MCSPLISPKDNCHLCKIELNDLSWLPSCKKKNKHICKFCVQKDNNQRYQKKKQQYSISNKLFYKIIKSNVFDYYGGKCNICSESDYDKLSIDHINGNGRTQRKIILKTDSGTSFYKWILKNKPDYLRILCYNCNCQHSMDITDNIKHNYQVKLKYLVFEKYGNKCSNCNHDNLSHLTIDHINNDGNEHRKIIYNIYSWLRSNDYPTDNFQILCYNCNYLKHFSYLKNKH